MLRFAARRVTQSIAVLVGVSVAGFLLMQLAPGGPLAVYAFATAMGQEDIARLEHEMGLDLPLPLQYGRWALGLLHGYWGLSYRDNRPVLSDIWARLPATFELMGIALLLAAALGISVGLLGALWRYSIFDYLSTTGILITYSIPTFWFGLMAIVVLAVTLRWLPPGDIATMGMRFSVADHIRHLVLPVSVLSLVLVAPWSRYTRSGLLDVLGRDFIRTAHAKGVRQRTVVLRHALRNALIPLITLAGLQMPMLLGGALVTETVFSWPGMGRFFLDSVGYRDYPVLMGILLLTAIFVVTGNLVADMLYAAVDPRIRFT
jgi:peptide/nickel transport system permease protein